MCGKFLDSALGSPRGGVCFIAEINSTPGHMKMLQQNIPSETPPSWFFWPPKHLEKFSKMSKKFFFGFQLYIHPDEFYSKQHTLGNPPFMVFLTPRFFLPLKNVTILISRYKREKNHKKSLFALNMHSLSFTRVECNFNLQDAHWNSDYYIHL